jgi:hypothetical protein
MLLADLLDFHDSLQRISPNLLIDKNSLWGGLNIQKRQLCVKGFLAQDLGFVLGRFQRGFGGFSG